VRAVLPDGVVVLLNTDGGTVAQIGAAEAARQIAAAFAECELPALVLPTSGAALGQVLRARLAGSSGGGSGAAFVVAGGDGSIGTAAQELAGTGVPLGVIPLGTRNHFARDLGLPLDIPGAVAVIAAGHVIGVDLGEVNGQVFVNNSSIGLYPAMLRDVGQQRRQNRRRKALAMAIALLRVLRQLPVRRLRIEAEGWVRPLRTPFAFIGNNCYALELPMLGRRPCLDAGELCLFIAHPVGGIGLLRLLLRLALGRIDEASEFERFTLRELVIHSRRHHLHVSHDGELASLRPPLRYRVRPAALRVLAPPAGGR